MLPEVPKPDTRRIGDLNNSPQVRFFSIFLKNKLVLKSGYIFKRVKQKSQ